MKINAMGPGVSFGRKLRGNEKEEYKGAINDALRCLNKDLGIILHHSSAPSKEEQDTGIGSLYSEASRSLVAPFLEQHGFTSIQVEPETTRKKGDPSPYAVRSNLSNVLMSDLYLLTTDEFGNLLSKDTFDKIVEGNPRKGDKRVDFGHVNKEYAHALDEVWENFKKGNGPQIEALRSEFETFKKEKQNQLESSILYEVLSIENRNDYYKEWKQKDKDLYKLGEEERAQRINDIKQKYADKIDYLYFTQMLLSKMREKSIEEYSSYAISTIGDAPVAFSASDEWSHPDLFLKDYRMGCVDNDEKRTNFQKWDFPVYDPSKLFDGNGGLAEGGKFMYDKYRKLFEENRGGVRIDHIWGLINPYVYRADNPYCSGRLLSTQYGELRRYCTSDLTQIMKKIVIRAAKDAGLSKDNIICEALGSVPPILTNAFSELGLPGMSVTRYEDNGQMPSRNVAMIGSHDMSTLRQYTDHIYLDNGAHEWKDKNYDNVAWELSKEVLPKSFKDWEVQPFYDKMGYYKHNIEKYDPQAQIQAKKSFMTSKFAQLFTSPAKSVQIFWPDVIGEYDAYNGNTVKKGEAWTLRMKNNFEDEYHKNLENGIGLNLPEVLALAIRQKGTNFERQHEGILELLDKYKNILKAPEDK